MNCGRRQLAVGKMFIKRQMRQRIVIILHIPGGCTYLCQPLDVGVNRPLTRMVKAQWDDWMETEGASTLQKPSRKQIGEWVLKAWNDLDEQHVRNSRKKKGFKWVL
eukprot:scaffold44062_cov82-Cyclotella_meneghiniana.AAC.1